MVVNMAIVLLLLLTSCWGASLLEASSVAKPKCIETCRGNNVTIPFPFGIGPTCFLDEWFEIVCVQSTTNNSNDVPRLKKRDLEVLNISLPDSKFEYYYIDRRSYGEITVDGSSSGEITVALPIINSSSTSTSPVNNSCTDNMSGGMSFSMEGSPFYFSSNNMLTAVGCNVVALMHNTESAIVGCESECKGSLGEKAHEKTKFRNCSGHDGCCQTTIPPGLQAFNIYFQKANGGAAAAGSTSDQCSSSSSAYAFLVDSSSFIPNATDLHTLLEIRKLPVVLDWGIPLHSNTGFNMRKGRGDYDYKLRLPSYYCQQDVGNNNSYCYCQEGYKGNPYLVEGCQDINECEDPELAGWVTRVCGGKTCKNTIGHFSCVDRSKAVKLVAIALGGAIGALLLLVSGSWLYKCLKRRKNRKLREKYFKRNGGLLLQQQLASPEGNIEKSKLFNLKELETVTDKFNASRILGQGGQGTVYKGMLTDGRIVAIKKSLALAVDEGYIEQFINEVFLLSQINHRNVVKLLGCCLDAEVPLLVYEFIPNGTLYQYLHDPNDDFQVSWDVRLRIATEVARALSYLHSAASIPIYHRDVKTSNILLDEKYRAKVADFGTSRSVALDQTHVTTLVQGTFGYLDPEYFQSSQFTDKSDVYSFGVVLVELLTGQKPVSSLRANEGRSLATFFIISMEENCLLDILDAQVLNYGNREEILVAADLARRCLNLSGRNRPTMQEVATELESISKTPQRSNVGQNGDKAQEDNTNDGSIDARDVGLAPTKFGADADIISMSDVHPLLPGKTW